jgi:hypothetical protein
MRIWEKIIEAYPELTKDSDLQQVGIFLKDDGDGIDYVEKWEYVKPLPNGLKLGKPTS